MVPIWTIDQFKLVRNSVIGCTHHVLAAPGLIASRALIQSDIIGQLQHDGLRIMIIQRSPEPAFKLGLPLTVQV